MRGSLPAHVVLLCLMIRRLLTHLAMLVLAVWVLRVVIVDCTVLSLLTLLAALRGSPLLRQFTGVAALLAVR